MYLCEKKIESEIYDIIQDTPDRNIMLRIIVSMGFVHMGLVHMGLQLIMDTILDRPIEEFG